MILAALGAPADNTAIAMNIAQRLEAVRLGPSPLFPFLDRGRVHMQEIHQPDGEDQKVLQISLPLRLG